MLSANKGKILSTGDAVGITGGPHITCGQEIGVSRGAAQSDEDGRYRLYEFVVTANGTVDITINVNEAGEAIVSGFGRSSVEDSRLPSVVRVGDALVMVGAFEVSSVWKGRPHGHPTNCDAIHALLDRAPRPTILKFRSLEAVFSESLDPKAATTTALIKSRTVSLCNESRAQGSMVSYLRVKTALLNEFSKGEIEANKGAVQACIVMAYREDEGPIHSQPSLITGEVGRMDAALGRKDYSVLPKDLEIRIQYHSHKLRIVPPQSERGARLWLCKLCRENEQQRITFRFRCCMTCDWDVCDVCVSTILGQRKLVTLRRRIGVPLGIQFSGTMVTAVVEGSPAEECGQIFMGDIVTAVNKTSVKTLQAISTLLQESHGKVLLELAEPFPARARERRKKLISIGKDGKTNPVTSPSSGTSSPTPISPALGSFAEEMGPSPHHVGAPIPYMQPISPTPSSGLLRDVVLMDTSSMDVATLRSALRQMESRCNQLVNGTQRLQRGLDTSTQLLSFCESKRAESQATAQMAMAELEKAKQRAIEAERRADTAEARVFAAEQSVAGVGTHVKDLTDLNETITNLSDLLAAAKSNEKSMLMKCATVGKQNHMLELELKKQAKTITDLTVALAAK